MTRQIDPILLTGATGYVGATLLPRLTERGWKVRAMTRTPRPIEGATVVTGDALSGEGLEAALEGCRTAYYLIHSMQGSSARDFAKQDRQAAHNFGSAAQRAGVQRIIYLGGLGPTGPEVSEHLRSRHEVATILASYAPELVHVRAAMVIGEGRASFKILRHLVERLPVMVTPRWVETPSQPISIGDVVDALAALAAREDAPAEVQLGGADVLTYREMMQRFARLSGRRARPMVPAPVLTPKLSSLWVTLVTGAEKGLVDPLVEGLKTPTVVDEPPPEGINDAPLGFDDAVRAALR